MRKINNLFYSKSFNTLTEEHFQEKTCSSNFVVAGFPQGNQLNQSWKSADREFCCSREVFWQSRPQTHLQWEIMNTGSIMGPLWGLYENHWDFLRIMLEQIVSHQSHICSAFFGVCIKICVHCSSFLKRELSVTWKLHIICTTGALKVTNEPEKI